MYNYSYTLSYLCITYIVILTVVYNTATELGSAGSLHPGLNLDLTGMTREKVLGNEETTRKRNDLFLVYIYDCNRTRNARFK